MGGNPKFTISVDHEHEMVIVTYRGTITLEDRTRAVAEGSLAMEKNGYCRVLVDLTGSEMAPHSPEDESRFVHVLTDNRVLAKSRTAFLSRQQQTGNWFVELLARTRHYACRHFTDREEAREWLVNGRD